MRALCGAALLIVTLWAACDSTESQSCTEIGCSDGVAIVLRPKDGSWDEGRYQFEFRYDDDSHTCSLTLPDDLPSTPGSVVQLPCTPQLDATFSVEAKCTEQRTSGGVSDSCVPLAGRFRLDVRRDGTPKLVRVDVELDAASVFEHSEEPDYEESRPNGPDCDPLCRQAALDLSF